MSSHQPAYHGDRFRVRIGRVREKCRSLFSAAAWAILGIYASCLPPVHARQWISVPIITTAQREAGLSGGEGFQMVMDIGYAPSNPDIAYLAVDTSCIWKSIDGGATWSRSSRGLFTSGVRSLVVDPRDADVVYAAAFGGHAAGASGADPAAFSGIFRTRDGGRSWHLLKETGFFKQTQGRLLACHVPADSDGPAAIVLFAGSYTEGLLRSDDGGASWTAVLPRVRGIHALQAIPQSQGELWISAEDGLFKYDRRGLRRAGKGLPDFPRSVAVDHRQPAIVYAAVGKHGVYRSTDQGETFLPHGRGLPPTVFCANIAVSPADPNVLMVSFDQTGTPNPYYSMDGGATWRPPVTINDRGLFHVDTSGVWYAAPISFHPTDSRRALSVANGANIVMATDSSGKRWRYSNTGFTGGVLVQKTSLCFAGSKTMLFGLLDFGCWLTQDNGKSFNHLKTLEYRSLSSCSAAAMHADTIVAAIGSWETQAIQVSWDRGRTWTLFTSLEDRGHRFICFHPQQPSVIYAGKFRSDDEGRRWRELDHRVRAIYPADGDIVYSFAAGAAPRIFKSTDRGESWSPVLPTLPSTAAAILDISVDPRDPDQLYLGTGDGILILRHGVWRHAGPGQGLTADMFGLNLVRAVAVDPNRPEVLYAGKWSAGRGSSNGVFRSTDSGGSWLNISANLGPELEIGSIFINPADSTVYIGSYLGTWKLVP